MTSQAHKWSVHGIGIHALLLLQAADVSIDVDTEELLELITRNKFDVLMTADSGAASNTIVGAVVGVVSTIIIIIIVVIIVFIVRYYFTPSHSSLHTVLPAFFLSLNSVFYSRT